jgi:RNA recognition motif-containing protein
MSSSLFVGGLSWNTSEQSLTQYLSAVAPVTSVKIPRDKMTGKSRGFAFVEVADDAAAQQIIAQCNEREFEGRTVRINPAREEQTEERKLYVAGLADGVTEESLKAHLGDGVASVSIVKDRDTGRSRGFAFVDTVTDQDSDAIIERCNGSELDGSKLLVRKSRSKPERTGGGGGGFGGRRQQRW